MVRCERVSLNEDTNTNLVFLEFRVKYEVELNFKFEVCHVLNFSISLQGHNAQWITSCLRSTALSYLSCDRATTERLRDTQR